jgi:hypothetical protein
LARCHELTCEDGGHRHEAWGLEGVDPWGVIGYVLWDPAAAQMVLLGTAGDRTSAFARLMEQAGVECEYFEERPVHPVYPGAGLRVAVVNATEQIAVPASPGGLRA